MSDGARGARAALACCALVASACASAQPGGGDPPDAQPPGSSAGSVADALALYRWRVDDALDAGQRRIEVAPPGSSRAPVLLFSGNRIAIDGNCNRMSGSFRIEADGRLSVGRLASTMKACEPAAMRADAALADLLARPLRVDLARGAETRLHLMTDANETLSLSGEPTAEARYGPATIVFLEIAAERVPCNRPPMPAATCLQVRERRYDAQGLAVGSPSEWRPLYEEIEGFAHRAGERNVVRVKRYERKPAPADASAFVYVLDLVVESEAVRR